VLGIKLHKAVGVFAHHSPSLDRVVPNLGYVKGNVHVISWRANSLKKNATIEELEKIIQYMKEHINDTSRSEQTD